jgi:hypothetical protein
MIRRGGPWGVTLGAGPRPPGFIALGSGEEVENGKGDAFRFPLFPGHPAGARVAPQRCPILRRDIFRVREVIKKLNRTSVCAIDNLKFALWTEIFPSGILPLENPTKYNFGSYTKLRSNGYLL